MSHPKIPVDSAGATENVMGNSTESVFLVFLKEGQTYTNHIAFEAFLYLKVWEDKSCLKAY